MCSTERERARAYDRIREELRGGRQAFVVCPLVEESELLQARAATADVTVTLEVVPGVPHVFQAYAAILDEGDAALDRAATFVTTNFAAAR